MEVTLGRAPSSLQTPALEESVVQLELELESAWPAPVRWAAIAISRKGD